MFVGFIAVVIILLVIVLLMASGALSSSDNSLYTTEAKKVHALFSQLQGESKFYYSGNNETYLGIGMDYFMNHDFAGQNMIASGNMASADWEGWPTGVDGGFADPYTGPYIQVGGTAGDDMRIVASSINNGKAAVFFLLKKVGTTVPEQYTITLEKALAVDSNYIGG